MTELLPLLDRRYQARRRIAAPQFGMFAQTTQLSNGSTQLSGTDRMQFTPNTDLTALQVVLANGYSGSGSGNLVGPGNALKGRMSIEGGGTTVPTPLAFPSSSGAPVSSGGKTGFLIGDGEIQISSPDFSRGTLDAASAQYLRFYKAVASGEKWPLTYGAGNYNYISTNAKTTDQAYGSTDVTGSDQTHIGTPTWGNFSTSLFMAPLAVIGAQLTPKAVCMVTGDSISAGFNDTAGRGYIVRALETANIAYHNDGVISTRLDNMVSGMMGARYLAEFVDFVLMHIGTNSLTGGQVTTLAGYKTALLAAARAFTRPGNRLLFATVLPRPTGSLTDYNAQTKPAWEDLRVSINNWLRDPSENGAKAYLNAAIYGEPVLSIFDPCVQLERNVDGSAIVLDAAGQQVTGTGGYFLIGATGDNTHPNATGAALAGASVPTQLLTI